MCQCVARPAGDDEDGGHLSGVCREEEMPIEAGLTYYLTVIICTQSLQIPGVAQDSYWLFGRFLFQDKNKERVLGLCTGTGTNGVGQLASNTLSSSY